MKKILETRRKYIKNLYYNKIARTQEFITEQINFLNEQKEKLKLSKVTRVKELKDLKKLNSELFYYERLLKKVLRISNRFFNNKSNRFTVLIYLKSNMFKVLEVHENKNVQGFYDGLDYYSIDRESVINHGDTSIIIYIEGISAPLSLNTAIYHKDKRGENDEVITLDDSERFFDFELGSRTIKEVVNGNAFKSISNLGKTDFAIDWKFALIGLVIIVLGVLHATGTIDLIQLIGL